MKHYLFSVSLLIAHNAHVVLQLLDVDGDIHTGARQLDGNGLAVILVLEIEYERLPELEELVGLKGEVDQNGLVALDLGGSLEGDHGHEFIHLGHLELFLCNSFFFLLKDSVLLLFFFVFLCEAVVSVLGLLSLVLLFLVLPSAFLALAFASIAPLLLLLLEVGLRDEGDGPRVGGLDVDGGGEGAGVLDLETAGEFLLEDDVSEVDERAVDGKQGLLAGAEQGDVDGAGFSEDGEDFVDVLVDLGREGDLNGSGEAGTHAAGGREDDVEEVLDRVREGQEFEGVEAEAHVGHQNGLGVRHAHLEVLEQNAFGLRNKRRALELLPLHYLRLHNALFLTHCRRFHVLLLQRRQLRLVELLLVPLPELRLQFRVGR